jgi:outer membrane protein assembly factor BamB
MSQTSISRAPRSSCGWEIAGLLCLVSACVFGADSPAPPTDTNKFYAAPLLWKAKIPNGTRSSPAVGHDGAVYLGTQEGKLIALNPDGGLRWTYRTGSEIVASPAIGTDNTIYFGCRDRYCYALADSGRLKWRFATRGWVDASPAIGADESVFFGSWDGTFYALDHQGRPRWQFGSGGPIVSSAAIDASGTVYFGSHDQKFYALNPDGSKRWEYATRGAITSSPALGAEGELYFTSVDGHFYSLAADGTLRWKLHTGGITSSSPVIGPDGTIYVSVNQTHCAILPGGAFRWKRNFWHPEPQRFGESAAAVLANNLVVFCGGDGFVMTVPGDNGTMDWIWNYYLLGPSYSSVGVAADGTVYATGGSIELYALKNPIPLASSAWPMFRGDPQHTGRGPAAK